MKYRIIILFTFFFIINYIYSQDLSNIKKKDLFNVTGNISSNFSFSDYGSRRQIQSPWAYSLSSSLNFKLAGFDIPLSFIYANGNKNFVHPFVRMGISPKYKKVQLHIGYRSLNLSSAIFSGKTFLGAGAEIKLKYFRFAGFYGNLESSVYITGKGVIRDFDRKAYGVKIGFGSSKNHIDFVAFKAQDDAGAEKFKDINNYENNSSNYYSYSTNTPQDNLVLGSNIRFSPFKFLYFRSIFALSGYTPNVNGSEFQFNDKNLEMLQSFIKLRSNSKAGYLLNSTANLQFPIFGVSYNYRIISNDYKTLGISHMGTNLTSSSINANTNLFHGRISLTGFFSNYSNNFNGKQLTTTKRESYGASLNTTIGNNLNISANYSGTRSHQEDGTGKVDKNTRLDMSTHTFNVSPSYDISGDNIGHNISFSYDYSNNINNNKLSEYNYDSENMLLMSSYGIRFIKYDLSIGASYSYTRSEMNDDTDLGNTININAQKSFLEKKQLSVGTSFTYGASVYRQFNHPGTPLGTIQDNENKKSSISFSGNIRYSINKNHRFSSNFAWNSYLNEINRSNYSFRASLTYSYTLPNVSAFKNKNKK